jgi:hypothetical protein
MPSNLGEAGNVGIAELEVSSAPLREPNLAAQPTRGAFAGSLFKLLPR